MPVLRRQGLPDRRCLRRRVEVGRGGPDVRRGGYTPGKEVAAELIGAPWMSLAGLQQSIPPAYTRYLGGQLIAALASA